MLLLNKFNTGVLLCLPQTQRSEWIRETGSRKESLELLRFRHFRHLQMCSTETSKQTCYSSILSSDHLCSGRGNNTHPFSGHPYLKVASSSSPGLHPPFNSKQLQAKWENKMTSRCTVYLQRKHVFSCTPKWSYSLYVHTNERN